ncbi:MAG: ATP-binding protein [Planctomycetota bacterium]
MLLLTVSQGPQKGKQFSLPDNEPQLLGRSSEALPITDNTVSRRHAELTPDGGLWFIRDLKSHNGTYVNGVQITKRVPLKAGDQIRVGSTVLAFGGVVADPDSEIVEVLHPDEIDAEIERTLASNEDSVLMAEPEPRRAASEHLKLMYRVAQIATEAIDQQELLAEVLETVFDQFEPERGVILIAEDKYHSPKPVVVKFMAEPTDPEDAKIQVSQTILQHAVSKRESVLSSNAMADPRFKAGDSVQRFGIRSAMCAPILFRDRVFGAIYIDSSIVNYTFTAEQLALLNAVGRQAGLAMANLELVGDKIHTERLAVIGETVASLSHSIKNILQGLRGGADVVEMGLGKDDLKIAKGGWAILKRNLDRIMALTLNMLAFSRQRHLEVELTKMGPLLDDCAQLLEGLCQTRQVALLTDVDPDIPPLPMDPNLIHQAMMNLMTNAVEAVEPKSGVVTVRVQYHPQGRPDAARKHAPGSALASGGASAEIAVIDNGPGIESQRLAWIFEPFNTTKGMRGTGLGLAVTKRIIEDHHGAIWVERTESSDRSGGGGATFRIELPADPSSLIDPSATASAPRDPASAVRRL